MGAGHVYVHTDVDITRETAVRFGVKEKHVPDVIAGIIAHELYHVAQISGYGMREGEHSGRIEPTEEEQALEVVPQGVFAKVARELMGRSWFQRVVETIYEMSARLIEREKN